MVSRVALGLALPLAAIAAWQIAGALGYEYLSSPTAVAAALRDLISDGELFADLAHTLFVALLAALIATVAGGVVGFFVGSVTFVRRYLMAGIDVLRAVPATALVPVALLALGPAVHTEVVLAAYAAVWPVLLGTAAGVASVHPRQYDVARVLHLSRSARIRKIVLPAALPGWLAGARMAAIAALLVAIVAELIIGRAVSAAVCTNRYRRWTRRGCGRMR